MSVVFSSSREVTRSRENRLEFGWTNHEREGLLIRVAFFWRSAVRANYFGLLRDRTKKPGTGGPLHTQEPVTVASFRTVGLQMRCAGPMPDQF